MRKIFLSLVAVAALAGCTFGQSKMCTLSDMDSEVSVIWRPADFEDTGGAMIRVCVDGSCEERASGDPSDPIGSVSVRLPQDIGAKKLPVELTVTPVKGGTPVKDTEQAQLTEEHPNGKGCEPVAYIASFRADPVKGLVSTEGFSLQGK
ncbi:lipoprotein [Streptomyces sp. ME02-6991-2A]|uniref:membrane lipoprotein lipid attachment site-containing protein n=1 Tax=Streptomyces sp. ME02-6991-2A TaxID=3028677 RepID=UPI0029A34BAE|nr:lipoprotein [Streptomyces sp. ME02-6991-2A]MDX3379405.1 lipoprotein [Streptomyces sp. ME02-6991-2A]